MPVRTDLESILIIGSGPIAIGQACEFDYSATQACIALKELGYRIILVNSNPATIMTDPQMADATYIEPITVDTVTAVIAKEGPDALLSTMGGQTGLNCAMDLHRQGVLDKYEVELIGARYESIQKAEDRRYFKEILSGIGLETPTSHKVENMDEAMELLKNHRLPLIIRPSFTLGGHGAAIARDPESYYSMCQHALQAAPYSSIQVDESIIGWKEFELEVMRDEKDNNIIVCSIENLDPAGIHTGDSVTVAPAQTLSDKEYQRMRNATIAIMREIGVDTGGANVQFAMDPKSEAMLVIEMNPRVSRSSALVSKACGYPIAAIAAKLAVGYTLDNLLNGITGDTIPASFEPTLDYVVTKIPRFDMNKFPTVNAELGIQMKSVGEVMAVGRNFSESLQKALCSLEQKLSGFSPPPIIDLDRPKPLRLLSIAEALRKGVSVQELQEQTGIDPWFLDQIQEIVDIEHEIGETELSDIDAHIMRSIKQYGFSDEALAGLLHRTEDEIRNYRKKLGCLPNYNRIDTCAAEFSSNTDYLYSTYDNTGDEFSPYNKTVIIIGSGPNRIGQGIEFDYCCVHAVQALREAGYRAIMINSNPETVSTDYRISDRLYFEPLNTERVLDIIDRENPLGVIVQFGGQTALKLVDVLKQHNIPILGSSYRTIHRCEDRHEFRKLIDALGFLQPPSLVANSREECLRIAETIHYPLIVRPSYVIGGSSMYIIRNKEEFAEVLKNFDGMESFEWPLLLEHYLESAVELDIDAVRDGSKTVICGVMEHIEAAGIHSGDSAASYPPHSLSLSLQQEIEEQVRCIANEADVLGLINVQCAILDEKIYIIEVNPRASRSIPFIAKVNGYPWVNIATRCIMGETLAEQKIPVTIKPCFLAVKESVFPFIKFNGSSAMLGPQMKSTGEVMGIASNFSDAYRKAQLGAGFQMPEPHTSQSVIINAFDEDDASLKSIAQQLHAHGFSLIVEKTLSAALESVVPCTSYKDKPDQSILTAMEKRNICFVIHVSQHSISPEVVGRAIDLNLFYATTLNSVMACIQTFDSKINEYYSIQEYYKKAIYESPIS